MKIIDTLKQIIEKVEPYMDKTLSEGCLIGTGDMRDIIYKIVGKETEHYTKQFKECDLLDTRRGVVITDKINNHKYIYGHLDITAVLKYIESNIAWHTNYSNAWGKRLFLFLILGKR